LKKGISHRIFFKRYFNTFFINQMKNDPDVKEIWAGAKFAALRTKHEMPVKGKK